MGKLMSVRDMGYRQARKSLKKRLGQEWVLWLLLTDDDDDDATVKANSFVLI